jgi:hypothetical protein
MLVSTPVGVRGVEGHFVAQLLDVHAEGCTLRSARPLGDAEHLTVDVTLCDQRVPVDGVVRAVERDPGAVPVYAVAWVAPPVHLAELLACENARRERWRVTPRRPPARRRAVRSRRARVR